MSIISNIVLPVPNSEECAACGCLPRFNSKIGYCLECYEIVTLGSNLDAQAKCRSTINRLVKSDIMHIKHKHQLAKERARLTSLMITYQQMFAYVTALRNLMAEGNDPETVPSYCQAMYGISQPVF